MSGGSVVWHGVRSVTRMPAQALVRRLPPALAEVARRPLPRDPSLRGRARRVLLRVLREGGVPAHVRVFQLVDNPQLRFVAADSLVLSQLYWYGEQGWEPELLPWWRHCCRHAGGVLELGANVGYFTVQGGRAAPSTRYLAVEPHPVSWRVCRDNLTLNGVTSVQLLAAAAVTDPTISTVSLHVPADQLAAPTVAFLTDDGELPREMARDVRTTLEVPAVDVRELLDGVDLLKLDVEGQEHALLSAARAHLRDQRPTVFVEVLPGTRKLRALLAELCEHDGYRCYVPAQDRLTPVERARLATIRLKDEFGHQDLILSAADVPRTPADLDGDP